MRGITAGATSALGKISMTGYSSDNLTGMIEKVTAGATKSLGDIKMTGYDHNFLDEMFHDSNRFAIGVLDIRNLIIEVEIMIFDNDPLLIGCVDYKVDRLQ